MKLITLTLLCLATAIAAKELPFVTKPSLVPKTLTISDDAVQAMEAKIADKLSREDAWLCVFESKGNPGIVTKSQATSLSGIPFDGLGVTTVYDRFEASETKHLTYTPEGTESTAALQQFGKQNGSFYSYISNSDSKTTSGTHGEFKWVQETIADVGTFNMNSEASASSTAHFVDEEIVTEGSIVFTSKINISSAGVAEHKDLPLQLTMETKGETFLAGAQTYVGKFESNWAVSGISNRGGKIWGNILSEVVESVEGTTLTKSTIHGFIQAQNDRSNGITSFQLTSNVLTKTSATDAETKVVVGTSVSGKVYEQTELGGGAVELYLSTAKASFEKTTVVIPKIAGEVNQKEFGLIWTNRLVRNEGFFKFSDLFSTYGIVNLT